MTTVVVTLGTANGRYCTYFVSDFVAYVAQHMSG